MRWEEGGVLQLVLRPKLSSDKSRAAFGASCVPSLSCPSQCQKAPLPVHANNNALSIHPWSEALREYSPFWEIAASLKPNLECSWKFLFAENHFTGRCGLGKRQIIDCFCTCTTSHNVCVFAQEQQLQLDDCLLCIKWCNVAIR